MAFNVELPHVGESVTEAVIGKWLKSPGDHVEKYDPLVEVITDKVNMDVPSPESGILTKIFAEEGETVLMGAVIAEMDTGKVELDDNNNQTAAPTIQPSAGTPPPNRIGTLVQGANVGPTGGEFTDTSLSTETPSNASGASGSSTPSTTRQKGFSPVVTRLASQHGVDLATLVGTGLGGRITKKDVLAAVDQGSNSSSTTTVSLDGDEIVEPSAIRRMIADHMVKSMSEIPHAWSAVEVDVSGMVEWRTQNKAKFESDHGLHLTYLPIALAVVASALKANPRLNSRWSDGKIVMKRAINIGVAVAAEEGLVVPVIHDANEANVVGLAQQLDGVVSRARAGKMTIFDVQGGTFTLNNTGSLGSVWGGAIINHPQAAILTTEAIVKRPIVISKNGEDVVAVRSMMNICLSFDHRIVDGAEASEFLQAVKTGLEAVNLESELT